MKWQPIDTAPKDKPILLNASLPWAVVGIWNDPSKQWCYSNLQVNLYQGHWNDTYWESEMEPQDYGADKPNVTHWMPLPQPPKE